jgi:hypothetical protein
VDPPSSDPIQVVRNPRLTDIDIDQDIEGDSFLSLFADDTRIARKVNSEEDIESLQADLEKLYKWQDSNNMQFNSKKFEILRYGKNQYL